jgi:hypothetical protein
MPTDDRLLQTLFRLRDLSALGKQTWERVPGRDDPDFESSIGPWTVEIQTIDGDGQPPYRLVVLNQNREVIESLETVKSVSGTLQSVRDERKKRNIALRELYDRARRQVTGVDAALDEITRILDEK